MRDTDATGSPVLSVRDERDAKDRTAQITDFYLRHRRWVLTVLGSYGVNLAQAEDAVQEAVVTAWKRPDMHIKNFPGWVVTVALNVVRSEAKQKGHGLEVLAREPWESSGVCGPDPGELAWELREAALRDAGQLPPDQCAAVRLKIEGWQQAEIAEALQKTPAQVAGLLYRGRQTLRELRRAREQQDDAPLVDPLPGQVPQQRDRTSAQTPAEYGSTDGTER